MNWRSTGRARRRVLDWEGEMDWLLGALIGAVAVCVGLAVGAWLESNGRNEQTAAACAVAFAAGWLVAQFAQAGGHP